MREPRHAGGLVMKPKIPVLPDAVRPIADMDGRRKPIRRPVRKPKLKMPIDARAMERVKSTL